MRENLRRLLAPRTLAMVGGPAAEAAVAQCRAIGYQGEIWPVHPSRTSIAGVPCFPSLGALPGAPDAAFVSVSRERSIPVVSELAEMGAGGVVCHASGFAEAGEYGAVLQRELVLAAGDRMALVGPNCLGLLNYLDGAALWPEQHGGARVDRGVAVIASSGNIAQNLTMQRRSLPLAQLVTIGNHAVIGVADLVATMLEDPRITAIGLCLEEVPGVAELYQVAMEALLRRVPVVVLKSGSSELGARVTRSHTGSLAGSDVLCDALFRRLGMARVRRVEGFVETLKFLHVHGALPGATIASASCSGGEAALVADLAGTHGVTLPRFSATCQSGLQAVLGDRVSVRNPLDYHTYIWGDQAALTACFTAFLGSGCDAHLLLLDLPREDRCATADFEPTLRAFEAAHEGLRSSRACVVSSLPEGLPEPLGRRLLSAGIAPMQGIADCLEAISAAKQIGAAQASVTQIVPPTTVQDLEGWSTEQLDEVAAKTALSAFGLPVPPGELVDGSAAGSCAARLGFPVVLKAVSSTRTHKSEVGGVRVGLCSEQEVEQAVEQMSGLGDRFLVERMVLGAVAELLVGVQRDPQFGLALTLGAGGVLAELIADTATLLLPATAEDILAALRSLRVWALLDGFRGRAKVDVGPVVEAISGLTAFAEHHANRLVELEVNPLLVLPDHVVAVDAMVRFAGTVGTEPTMPDPYVVTEGLTR